MYDNWSKTLQKLYSDPKIRCTLQYNHKCLCCNSVNKTFVRVGVLDFCYNCFDKIFHFDDSDIVIGSRRHEIYKDWLKVYHEDNK